MPDLATLSAEVHARVALPPPHRRREIREAAGISQARLAEAVGVTDVSILYWERGGTPRRGNLEAYVEALRMLDSIVTGEAA